MLSYIKPIIFCILINRLRHHILRGHGISIKSTMGKNLIVKTKSQPFLTVSIQEGHSVEVQEGATVPESATLIESAILIESGTLQEGETLQDEIIEQDQEVESGSRIAKICYTNITPSSSDLFQEADSSILSQTEILRNFQNWMESMDGGCHVKDICKKAKMIIGNMLQELNLHGMKDPDKVCKYFTSKQMKKEITAGTTDVYLRFYA